jgi:putative phosphoribosyl transferase
MTEQRKNARSKAGGKIVAAGFPGVNRDERLVGIIAPGARCDEGRASGWRGGERNLASWRPAFSDRQPPALSLRRGLAPAEPWRCAMADRNSRPGPLDHAYDPPEVEVSIEPLGLPGTLVRPAAGQGIVLFAHGSGSSRLSPRNRLVAKRLQRSGLGTLLFDLLQPEEADNRANVFDIHLLAERLALATDWIRSQELRDVPIGYFGASTGAGAALVAETLTRHPIAAVVSRGGRPDLAGAALPRVRAATLLIVGGEDHGVIELNQEALARLTCERSLTIVPGAGHLFEEPGTLDEVVALARDWFVPRLRQGG